MADIKLDFVSPDARLALAAAKRAEDVVGDVTGDVARSAVLTRLGNGFTSTTELNAYTNSSLALNDTTTVVGDGQYKVTSLSPLTWTRQYDSDGKVAIDAKNTALAGMSSLYASATETIGRPVDPITGTAHDARFDLMADPVQHTGTLASVKLFVMAAGTVTLARYTKSGSVYTRVATYTFTTSTLGLQTFTAADYGSIPVNAGDYLGIHGPGLYSFTSATADGSGFFLVNAPFPASFTPGAAVTTLRAQVQFNVSYQQQVVTAAAFQAMQAQTANVPGNTSAIALLNSTVSQVIGRQNQPVNATAITDGTILFYTPSSITGFLTSVELYVLAAGTITIGRYTRSGDTWTLAGSYNFATSATGNQTFTSANFGTIPINAGDYISIRANTNGLFTYTTARVPDSTAWWLPNGATPASFTTPSFFSTTSRIEVRMTITTQQQVTGASVGSLQQQISTQVAAGSPVIPLAAADRVAPISAAAWTGFLSYGQSLSVGLRAGTAMSTVQPYFNLTFGGGPRAGKPGNAYGAVNTSPGTTTTKPLVEDNVTPGADGSTGVTGETITTTVASVFVERAALFADVAPADNVVFASAPGRSGASIATLSKSASASAWYNNLRDHVKAAATFAAAAGKAYTLPAVSWMQGDTDARDGTTQATYRNALVQLQIDIDNDLRADINAIMSANSLPLQTTPIHLLIYQTAEAFTGTLASLNIIRQAQLDAVKASNRIHFVGPISHLQNSASDTTHLLNLSERRYGASVGRALSQLVIEQRKPDCLWPLSAVSRTVSGVTTLRVKFRVPKFPMVLDTATFGNLTDLGFKVIDDTGTLVLSNIAVNTKGDEVTMTLDRALGANPLVRHGMDYKLPTNLFGVSSSGILRDSTPDVQMMAEGSYPMWHMAPAFQLPVFVLQAPY